MIAPDRFRFTPKQSRVYNTKHGWTYGSRPGTDGKYLVAINAPCLPGPYVDSYYYFDGLWERRSINKQFIYAYMPHPNP